MQLFEMIILGIVIALVIFAWRTKKTGVNALMAKHVDRVETMFRSMFPDLQPHFHPARVHEFVKARRARAASGGAFRWKSPPGFAAAAEADIAPEEGARERVRLLDAAGAVLAEFVFEEHAEGGTLRLGKGKFTVDIRSAVPRVRYWHPDREFKWTAPGNWKFQSRLADEPLASSDSATSSSDSSSSSVARGAAAGAGIVAAGGSFDGGGASGAWDDAGGGSSPSSSSSSDSSPDFSSVASGSSSSTSTSY